MERAVVGLPVTSEAVYNLVVRAGVGLVTAAIHWSLHAEQSRWLLLCVAVWQVVIYPLGMLLHPLTRTSNRVALGIDTFIYGIYQGLWGLNPILFAIYLAGANTINMAAGGLGYLGKTWLFYALGASLGFGLIGCAWRVDLPLTTLLLNLAGLTFFLTAFGFRVFKINSHIRQTRNHLSAKTKELQSLNDLAIAVNSYLDINILLEKIMATIERIYPFEALYIVRFDESEKVVEVTGIYGSSITHLEHAGFRELSFDMQRDSESVFVRSLVKRKVAYLPQVTPELVSKAAEIDRKLFAVKPSVSLVYLPVYIKDTVVAGACFINYSKPFHLEPSDIEKIQDFLVQVGTAIRNTSLFKELVTANQDAEEARAKAEASEEAKSRFLANMSHEIRTPLTAVLGYAEALQEDLLDPQSKADYISYILRSGRHLLAMINDILDISKIEAQKFDIEQSHCDYIDILHDIDSYLKIKTREKNLEYHLDVRYPIPSMLMTDPTRLQQILLNLCNNAVKFTKSGAVTLALEQVDGNLHFSVTDTGIGIDETVRERIFHAFDQGDSSTTRIFGGTGLGLFISKSLAELLGGSLTVRSAKDKGSTFTLSLPVIRDGQNAIANSAQWQQKFEHIAETKQNLNLPVLSGTALLVEDNLDNQQIIKRLVEQTGLQLDVVADGASAISAACAHAYDLILMDMQMPIMGGKEAAAKIKDQGVSTPIVAFTANVMKHQLDDYFANGFVDVLEKPITRHRLHATLVKLVGESATSAGKRILIVDDNDVNQLILHRYVNLACPAAQVQLASNGAEAVDLVQKHSYDLILMDMEMPKMSGLEATQYIRTLGKHMPIYVVTGHTGREITEKCLSAGANGHITKPLEKHVIVKTINKALRGQATFAR